MVSLGEGEQQSNRLRPAEAHGWGVYRIAASQAQHYLCPHSQGFCLLCPHPQVGHCLAVFLLLMYLATVTVHLVAFRNILPFSVITWSYVLYSRHLGNAHALGAEYLPGRGGGAMTIICLMAKGLRPTDGGHIINQLRNQPPSMKSSWV